MKPPAQHLVLCADQIRCYLGTKQAEWAVKNDLIAFGSEETLPPTEHEGAIAVTIRTYRSDLGAWDLNEAIAAVLSLRECDVCGKHGPWEIPMRQFEPSLPSLTNTVMGGPRRPFYCCFMCGQHVLRGDRRQLRISLERRAVRVVAALHGLDTERAQLHPDAAAGFRPAMSAFVDQILTHTHGKPTRRR